MKGEILVSWMIIIIVIIVVLSFIVDPDKLLDWMMTIIGIASVIGLIYIIYWAISNLIIYYGN